MVDGRNWRRVPLAVIACEAAGAASAGGTGAGSRQWLPTLDQPPFQAPGWLFGPVWGAPRRRELRRVSLRRSPKNWIGYATKPGGGAKNVATRRGRPRQTRRAGKPCDVICCLSWAASACWPAR
jgi:TspO/MBR family